MALTNPITIVYGDRSLGGSSGTYLLHDPYVIERTHESIRVAATVVVSASSLSSLQSACEDLEDDLSKRDEDFSVDLNGSKQEFTFGETVLNTVATVTKSGDPELDRGLSRAYAIEIVGSLPATATDGLRTISTRVDLSPARQKTVTLSGVYTAFDGSTATEQYEDQIDAKATEKLSEVDSDATFELVSEQTEIGRNNHELTFSRQYVELLADQSRAALDDPAIKDHRVYFKIDSLYTGEGSDQLTRLKRATANYSCHVDIDQTTDLQTVFSDKVLPHIKALFEQGYNPSVFAVETVSEEYRETEKFISATVGFVFLPSGSERVVSVQQSVAIKETRSVSMTHVHSGGEFDAYVDPGWAVRDRVWTRTVRVQGDDTPRRRIGATDTGSGAGPFPSLGGISSVDSRNDGGVQQDGWTIIQNDSDVAEEYIGNPDDGDEMKFTVLSEVVVERYSTRPSLGGGGLTQPTTGGVVVLTQPETQGGTP